MRTWEGKDKIREKGKKVTYGKNTHPPRLVLLIGLWYEMLESYSVQYLLYKIVNHHWIYILISDLRNLNIQEYLKFLDIGELPNFAQYMPIQRINYSSLNKNYKLSYRKSVATR